MSIVKRVLVGLVALVALALLAIYIIGPEPANVSGNIVVQHGLNYFVRPGFWQRGEVVRERVDDWSFVRKNGTIVLESYSPWFIPHSVRVGTVAKGKDLYITSAQYRMEKGYPDRLWTSNVWRDPRVRMKSGDKLYELTLVLVTDKTEAEKVWGRNPEYWLEENGQQRQVGYQHLYRASQRGIVEYGEPTRPRDFSGLPGGRKPDGTPSGIKPGQGVVRMPTANDATPGAAPATAPATTPAAAPAPAK